MFSFELDNPSDGDFMVTVFCKVINWSNLLLNVGGYCSLNMVFKLSFSKTLN